MRKVWCIVPYHITIKRYRNRSSAIRGYLSDNKGITLKFRETRRVSVIFVQDLAHTTDLNADNTFSERHIG